MMQKSLPFDHRPDPVLGAALRQALSPDDHSTFVARVAAALAAPRTVYWDVLAAWARLGIAAACMAALAAGLLVGAMQPSAPIDLVASVAGPSARELVATVGPPDPSVVLVSAELR
jgi:hypothetical protein